jgi:diguanylate cyclase (GGDEF)-like protein
VRWGGEEFIALLPETAIETACDVAEKLREGIEQLEFDTIKKQITVSFGVSMLRENDSESSFIDRADEALYNAKKSGKNKVVTEAI